MSNANDGSFRLDNLNASPYSVIIGRQRVCRESVGNRRLQVLAMQILPKYAQAKTKAEKSKIVNSLVAVVHEAGGSFFKVVDGKWCRVDIIAARAKVGVVLRDGLHDKYRSSTKSKVVTRRHRQDQQQEEDSIISTLQHAAMSSCWLVEDDKFTWDPIPLWELQD